MTEHWVAHTRGGNRDLLEPERAVWLWTRLQARLAGARSCVFMPDHLHVVALPGNGDVLRRTLTGYTRRYGVRFDMPPPQPALSRAIALRQMRYGLFNPVRAGLVRDPWAWRWSTLRDLGGACHPVWTPLREVAKTLGLGADQALRRLTSLADHRPPLPTTSRPVVASLSAVVAAVASALRRPEADVLVHAACRRLVVQACRAIGEPRVAVLARELGCSRRTISRASGRSDPALGAVLRCIADARLPEGQPR